MSLYEQRVKVMVADDDPSRRRMILLDLESEGFWVLEANRQYDQDGIWDADSRRIPSVGTLLKSHYFPVAVVDLSFEADQEGERTGFSIIGKIHGRNEGTNCIVLTGYGSIQDVVVAWKEHRAFHFLSKDASKDELLEQVRSANEHAGAFLRARLRTNLTYSDLLNRPTLGEVKEALGVSGTLEISTIVEQALRPYSPFDKRRRVATFGSVAVSGSNYPSLEAKLWSRFLGAGIVLRVASKDACGQLAARLERRGGRRDQDFRYYEDRPGDTLAAVVEYVPAADPDEFLPENTAIQDYSFDDYVSPSWLDE